MYAFASLDEFRSRKTGAPICAPVLHLPPNLDDATYREIEKQAQHRR
jgi:hypothetical protein